MFSDDPPLTFTIDSFMTGDALDILAHSGLNAGAIVYVPDGKSALMLATGSRFGESAFRVSYLLAPVYKLPIRLGRSVALSRLLKAGSVESPQLFMDLGEDNE